VVGYCFALSKGIRTPNHFPQLRAIPIASATLLLPLSRRDGKELSFRWCLAAAQQPITTRRANKSDFWIFQKCSKSNPTPKVYVHLLLFRTLTSDFPTPNYLCTTATISLLNTPFWPTHQCKLKNQPPAAPEGRNGNWKATKCKQFDDLPVFHDLSWKYISKNIVGDIDALSLPSCTVVLYLNLKYICQLAFNEKYLLVYQWQWKILEFDW
jgi:hypothetical protein